MAAAQTPTTNFPRDAVKAWRRTVWREMRRSGLTDRDDDVMRAGLVLAGVQAVGTDPGVLAEITGLPTTARVQTQAQAHQTSQAFMSIKQRLHDVYDRLPIVACKGLCHESCGIIACTRAEADVMARASGGQPLTFDPETGRCSYLTDDKRCSVYRDRPFACRAYGAVDSLPCGHGCTITHRITKERERELFQKIREISSGIAVATPKQQVDTDVHIVRDSNHAEQS